MANLRCQEREEEFHSGQQSKHYEEGNVMFRELVTDIKSKKST